MQSKLVLYSKHTIRSCFHCVGYESLTHALLVGGFVLERKMVNGIFTLFIAVQLLYLPIMLSSKYLSYSSMSITEIRPFFQPWRQIGF